MTEKSDRQVGFFIVICLQYFFLFPLTASAFSAGGKV
jgi:hypothetical protein